MKPLKIFLFIAGAWALADGIPIDNGVEGDPEINCASTSVGLKFRTRNPFGGHVYVKGRFNEVACRTDGGYQAINNEAGLTVAFDTCGVRRSRSANPRGILMSVTILIMFHSKFMTKIDRAYYVQCFYMEAEKTVTVALEVSMLSTTQLLAQAQMPACRYAVLDSRGGSPVRYAKVGDQVHHRWTCEATILDAYCMVVHTCTVDDGTGNTVTLIDSDGCAQDQYLLGNLEYYDDLTVGRDAHVFKYADKSTVSFNCQISVAPKQENLPCPRPSCQDPTQTYVSTSTLPPPPFWDNRSRVKRRFRFYDRTVLNTSYHDENAMNGSVVDVDTQSILVFDLDSRLDSSNLNRFFAEKYRSAAPTSTFCVPKTLFSIYAIISAVMVVISFLILSTVSYRQCNRRSSEVSRKRPNDQSFNESSVDDAENGNRICHSAYYRFFSLRLKRN